MEVPQIAAALLGPGPRNVYSTPSSVLQSRSSCVYCGRSSGPKAQRYLLEAFLGVADPQTLLGTAAARLGPRPMKVYSTPSSVMQSLKLLRLLRPLSWAQGPEISIRRLHQCGHVPITLGDCGRSAGTKAQRYLFDAFLGVARPQPLRDIAADLLGPRPTDIYSTPS